MKKLLILAIFSLSTIVNADVVYLTNGDKISGTVKNITGGNMVLNSALAGDITISVENIASFETDAPIKMQLSDGSTLNQPVQKAADGSVQTAETDLLKPQTIEIASISAVNPPAPTKPSWKGNIVAGLTMSNGNTDKTDYNLSLKAVKRTDIDRTTLSADYAESTQTNNAGNDTTTEEWWKMRAKYDYYFTKKFYGYLDGKYETDKIAELDRRVILGGGVGYQWIESDKINFSTDIGLASRYEKYDNDPESSTEFSAQLGYYFDWQLRDNLTFIHETTFYPSFESFSDEYYLSTYAQLKYQMSERIFASMKAILDYDKTPAVGTGSTDTKYIFGIGMNF